MSLRSSGKALSCLYWEAQNVVHPTLLWKISHMTSNSCLWRTFPRKYSRAQMVRSSTMDDARTQVIPYHVIWYGNKENAPFYEFDNHWPVKCKIMHSEYLLHDKNDGIIHFILFWKFRPLYDVIILYFWGIWPIFLKMMMCTIW